MDCSHGTDAQLMVCSAHAQSRDFNVQPGDVCLFKALLTRVELLYLIMGTGFADGC